MNRNDPQLQDDPYLAGIVQRPKSKFEEPTPQEPLGDSEGAATPAGCGPLEPVAWRYVGCSDEGSTLTTNYWVYNETNTGEPLYSADTIAALQAELAESKAHNTGRTDELIAATRQSNELQAENAELRKDAERYRWIRYGTQGVVDHGKGYRFNLRTPRANANILKGSVSQHLDAVIDAAMKEGK